MNDVTSNMCSCIKQRINVRQCPNCLGVIYSLPALTDEIERLTALCAKSDELLEEWQRMGERQAKRIAELEAQLKQAQRDCNDHFKRNDRLRDERDRYKRHAEGIAKVADREKATNERLRAALWEYGQHLPDCTNEPLFCDCGLVKAKNETLKESDIDAILEAIYEAENDD